MRRCNLLWTLGHRPSGVGIRSALARLAVGGGPRGGGFAGSQAIANARTRNFFGSGGKGIEPSAACNLDGVCRGRDRIRQLQGRGQG